MHAAELQWSRFVPPTEDWDHEHCSLCWKEFAAHPGDETTDEGYVYGRGDVVPATLEERTTHLEGMRFVEAPTNERWICSECFNDFEARFHWTGFRQS